MANGPYSEKSGYNHDVDADNGTDVEKSPHDGRGVQNKQSPLPPEVSKEDRLRQDLNATLANPLAGYSHAELADMGEVYARKFVNGADDADVEAFRLGAMCAQDPTQYASVAGLGERDREVMHEEFTRRWKQPRLLYLVIVLCSTCAAVQGMGQYINDLPLLSPLVLTFLLLSALLPSSTATLHCVNIPDMS